MRWFHGEREPVGAELLPVYLLDDRRFRSLESVHEGFRLLAPPLSSRVDPAPPARLRDNLWLDGDRWSAPQPARRPVERRVTLPFADAVAAVRDRHAVAAGTGANGRDPPGAVRVGSARLAFTAGGGRHTDGEWRIPGTLQVRRCSLPVPVELVVARWSSHRSELRLEVPFRRRRSGASRRYFDAAHAVMDALRDALVPRSAPDPVARRALRPPSEWSRRVPDDGRAPAGVGVSRDPSGCTPPPRRSALR